MIPKLALGTVQMGLKYGINNKAGKPSQNEIYRILDIAFQNGIEVLDTAYAYGDSEVMIGRYINDRDVSFDICTKLPSLAGGKQNISVKGFLDKSLTRLGMEYVEYYFLHNIKDASRDGLVDELVRLKNEGLIGAIGVSVYDMEEIDMAMELDIFSTIQLPMNFFDRRAIKGGYIEKLGKMGIRIFIRSIFLQGLFFKDTDSLTADLIGVKPFLDDIQGFALRYGIDMADLILGWFKYNGYGDYLVIGVETGNQLLANIQSYEKKIDEDIIERLNKLIYNINIDDDSILIDPRRW